MQETRQNKIARLLQKELSLIFQSQTRMMHGVMISVTRCRVSPDLSVCTAYLSVFPSEKGEEIIENVNANVKSVRYYNVAGIESATPFKGINIVVMEMNDGTKKTMKVVK
jgi:ribosome-binding factor A